MGRSIMNACVCVHVCIDQLRSCSGTYGLYAILRPCWRASAERVELWVLRFWAFLPAVIQYQHRPMHSHSRSDDNIKLHSSSTELWLSLWRTPFSQSLLLSVRILTVCICPPPVFLLGTVHPKTEILSFSQPCVIPYLYDWLTSVRHKLTFLFKNITVLHN